MNILNILESNEAIFIEDAVESKKIRTLVEQVNKSFTEMADKVREFNDFANSQLKGEYHHKLVMAKSLREYYESWQAVSLAYEAVAKEENIQIEKYNACKAKLLNNLRTLAKEAQKDAVVSQFDVFENNFTQCEPGHEVVILGTHGEHILTAMIEQLEEQLVVSGHFDEIEAITLEPNYSKVENNVYNCKQQAQELYGTKAGRLAKIDMAITTMEEIGKKVVFFETYKNDLELIGCNPKFIKTYEKNLEKQYVPFKKSLQKELRFEFEEICDLVVDETGYPDTDLENPVETTEVLNTLEVMNGDEDVAPVEEVIEEEPVEVEEVETEEVIETGDVAIDTNIDDIE